MSRTLVVNTIVVLQVFYLFNVRYLNTSSFNWQGVIGTPAVLMAVFIVILAQLVFTYLPVMHVLFDSRPLALADGFLLFGIGILMMIVLEIEKVIFRHSGWLSH